VGVWKGVGGAASSDGKEGLKMHILTKIDFISSIDFKLLNQIRVNPINVCIQ
jgi:hypothetical protein